MRSDLPYCRLSSFYFFYFATLGVFLPYWSLYLEDTGFDPLEIGELSAMLVGTKVIAPNIWGWIADHIGKSLGIIRLASFFAAVLFTGFFLDNSYLWFAWVTIGFSFFWNASLPQFEAVTLFHLKEDSHRYSLIRLWGSVGFIVAVLSVGRLLDIINMSMLPSVITALLFSIWLITLIIPEARAIHHNSDRVRVMQIIKKPEVIAFFLVYMLLQISHGPYYVFFSIYLKEYHYSGAATGSLWALGVIAEVILFVFMHRLIQRFSLRNILLTSLLLSVCRWCLIAWAVENMWLLVVAQLLHAASFGSSHIAAIHLVHRYFGTDHQGKGQALYSSLSFGLGAMIGSLYSGFFWVSMGSQWVYSVAAVISFLALIIALIWVGKPQKQVVLR